MLNINALRVFHAVVQCHSVVRAAETLFISQPAVSNALKRLQQQYEVQLFVKEGRALQLTGHGEDLYALTTRLFAIERDIEALFKNAGARQNRNIHLGLVTIYERFDAAGILKYFLRVDKDVTVSIHSGNSRSLMEQLANREIDMAITGEPPAGLAFVRSYYRTHTVSLVVPRGHRLFGKARFTPDDLRGERMVLKEPGSSVRAVMDAYFGKHRISPTVISELSNFDSNIEIMQKENCLAFFPDATIEHMLAGNPNFTTASPKDEALDFSTFILTRQPAAYPAVRARFIKDFLSLLQNEALRL
ncbi:LysR substrate-binding domain-containing protein [Desulfovibrio sp. SGI.169]|uniref:LysR substrate-binding domain-containing protein n=1 Tax=Desulfovibrio sp. SGI.169 TaxID=3420561 RepID=UPI003D001DA7